MSEVKDEETVIGVHHSGVELEEGMNTGKRNYCANCKRNVHCHVKIDGKEAEIIVREIEDQDTSEKCDIYGDLKLGLSREQLIKVLKKDPLKKFIPLKKSKVRHQ